MSYCKIRELKDQLDVAEDSEESHAIVNEIAEVIQDFCDIEGQKSPKSEIVWQQWEFCRETVVIQAIEYRLNIKEYDSLVTEFEQYLQYEFDSKDGHRNPWGVCDASYEYFRGKATNMFRITLVMK